MVYECAHRPRVPSNGIAYENDIRVGIPTESFVCISISISVISCDHACDVPSRRRSPTAGPEAELTTLNCLSSVSPILFRFSPDRVDLSPDQASNSQGRTERIHQFRVYMQCSTRALVSSRAPSLIAFLHAPRLTPVLPPASMTVLEPDRASRSEREVALGTRPDEAMSSSLELSVDMAVETVATAG